VQGFFVGGEMPETDHSHHDGNDCQHDELIQLELIDRERTSVHGPSTEIWRVRCNGCGKVFTERFIGD
jgi:hypothetical protein